MRRRTLTSAVVIALLASAAPLVSARPARAAGTPISRLVMMSEAGDYIGQGAFDDEVVLTPGPLSGTSPSFSTVGWDVWFRPPTGAPLTVGLYDDAVHPAYAGTGRAGLFVFGEGRACNSVAGRFRVDQADYDGSGNLVAFAARFEQHCDDATAPSLFGMVAWNATVPFYGHRLEPVPLAFPLTVVGASAATRVVGVTNMSDVAMTMTSVALSGADADQFLILGNGCTGVTVPAGGTCAVDVTFRPTRFGPAVAALAVRDEFTDWATPSTGQRIALSGTATVPSPPPSTDPPTNPPPVTPPPSGGLPYGGEFHPLDPDRILDTRTGTGTGGVVRPIAGGETLRFVAAGAGGVPAAGVSAVVVNLTATGSTSAGWLALHPSDEPWPGSSSVNFGAGQTVPNMAVMAVGADGRLALRNCCGTVDAVVDVVGWYGGELDPPGLGYQAMTPFRALDTRRDDVPVGAGESRVLSLTPIAPFGAEAVVVNLTATDPTAPTYVTAYPAGTAVPTASSVNVVAGETHPNLVTVKLGPDGAIALYNFAGSTHLIVDVVGFYVPSRSPRGRVLTGTPERLFDTRTSTTKPGPNSVGYLDFTDADGCVRVEAVIMNVTATEPTASTFLTVYPNDAPRPVASNLNVVAGQTSANLVVARVPEDGIVNIYNLAGSVHILGDIVGVVTKEDSAGGACAVQAFDGATAAPVSARWVPSPAV